MFTAVTGNKKKKKKISVKKHFVFYLYVNKQ